MSARNNTEKYVLAACVNPVGLGEEFEKLPPHITILPPFQMSDDQKPEFDSRIALGAEDWLPISGIAGYPAFFGLNHETQVMPINFIEPGVFSNAVITADKMGIDYEKIFAINYEEHREGLICTKINHPHITQFEGIEPNDHVTIHEMQLFCMGALKKVVSIYRRDGLDYEK